jgi:hypothetical protein
VRDGTGYFACNRRMKLFKKQNPDRLFAEEALGGPRQRAKMEKVLRDGVEKFLDYAIELREKAPEVFENLLEDYLLSESGRRPTDPECGGGA